MKRITALILIFAMTISYDLTVFAESVDWKESNIYINDISGGYMPFSPEDKYTSQQNPPSFTWPYVYNAISYDLIVCADSSLKDIRYQKNGISVNYYSFDHTFKTGTDYYWAVRYHTVAGTSAWSDARRFRIDPGAYTFTVDDIDKIIQRVPVSHPRIWTTRDNLQSFLDYRNTNSTAKYIYENTVENAKRYINTGEIPPEPTEFGTKALNAATKMTSMIQTTAFAYLLTGDKEIGDFAIKLMDFVSDWSWDDTNGPTSYKQQDQAHRDIALKTAMAYDWVYDLINTSEYSAEKSNTLNMITARSEKISHLIDSLKKNPYDSHGWTTIGYLGIIGIAMYDDIPQADEWLRGVIPMYAALIPPWSCQDGGWSQGTDYWQYSTNQGGEFMDVLALSGVLNLYDTAWMHNQYLWALYAYPEGSYGSFGDQSNRTKSESGGYTAQSMGRIAAFTKNPVAKWLSEQTGGLNAAVQNYYISQNAETGAHIPTDYQLSHAFSDIGWAIMTDSLTDTDRVQLSFKSSPWGAYNHSHADQNSFIIQAYGENLAIKSGYCDSYHTEHDNNITRKTFAHNTITTDDTDGQGWYTNANGDNDSLSAEGKLLQFVNQMSFDSLTGDATDAYMDSPAGNTEKIGRYVRNIIYIRPDVFVVIDDLAASRGKQSQFKWWLNSENPMEYTNNSAVITQGNARLRADVLYPQNTTAAYYSGFYDLQGKYWPANGGAGLYTDKNEQDRVSFATSSCTSTKMITTMSVYKNGENAKTPSVSYSADNSCIRLAFEDGTVVLANLTDGEAKYDNTRFDGAAVSYNNDSIMLTNGTKLIKDGNVLIETSGVATIAMGGGQLCLSTDDDTDIYIKNLNEYLKTIDIQRMRDINGRGISPATGITLSASGDRTKLSLQKGNYTLLESDNAPVSVVDMIPGDVSLHKENDDLVVEWTEKSGCSYDAEINGTVVRDVSSSYIIQNVTEESVSVRLRARIGSISSAFSDTVVYNKNESPEISRAICKKENNIAMSDVYINGVPKNTEIILGAYNNDGCLTDVKTVTAKSGLNTIRMENIDSEVAEVRMFLADKYKIAPLKPSACSDADSTALNGIFINGRMIDGFDDRKDSYTVGLTAENTGVYPSVTVSAKDGTIKVITADNPNEMKTEVRITSASGKTRTVTISFNFERGNKHRIDGAEEEDCFTADRGTSEGRLIANKAVFCYNHNGVMKQQSLNLYSETKPNAGGYSFGSRLCSDRNSVDGNRMEIEELEEHLQGWDYFVLPQSYYYSKLDCNNESLTFDLAENSDVVILSVDRADSLADDGFFCSAGKFGTARYMDAMGAEDRYYNIAFNNIPPEDIDKNGRAVNYDVLAKLIDVEPLKNPNGTSYTAEQYESEKPPAGKFKIVANSKKWTTKHKFVYKYSKSFDILKTGRRVSLDLSNVKSDKLLIIIKNAEAAQCISNVKYLGPNTFDELDDELKTGCTNDGAKASISYLLDGIIKNDFKGGADAHTNVYISMAEDLPELEGAYYFPIYSNLLRSNADSSWQRAYYFGLSEESGFKYPNFEGKTHDWYSFDLNKPACLYVITAGGTPKFIDSSWEKLKLSNPIFNTIGINRSYRTVYKKYINVIEDESEHIVMQTPGNTKAAYYLMVKPIN